MADGSGLLLATLRFGAFVALAVVAPGLGVQRLLRLRTEMSLVLPLGLAWCAASHWLALVLHPFLFPASCLFWLAVLLWPGERRLAREGPSLRGALAPIAACVMLFALTQYRSNRVAADGTFQLDFGEHVDTALHVGLSFELVDSYPPQVPGLAGVPMRYHVASHLVRAAACRWADIHPYDAINRFDITLWLVALVLALRSVAHAAGLGAAAVRLAGFAPLAADLSSLPGLLSGSPWWAFKLGGNFVEPLFFANSITPAMALALAALVALAHAERERGPGTTVLAVLLAAAVGFFKAFTGAQLLLALGVAWLFGISRRRLTPVLAIAGLALAGLALSAVAPAGAQEVAARVVPFAPLQPALRAFGMAPAQGLSAFVLGLSWLVLSLGLRAVGLPAAFGALRARAGVAPVALAAFALTGWPIATFVSVSADPGFDESFYFLQASGLVLWLFAATPLAELGRRGARSLAAAVASVACALLVSAPTVEFVARKANQPPEPIAASAVRAMRALRAASAPGEVVLARPLPREHWVPLPMVLAGRRVVFSNYLPYWRQFSPDAFVAERDRSVRRFFRSTDPAAAAALACELGASFVYLTGSQRVDFDPAGLLEPVFEEATDRVYRIRFGPTDACRQNAP